MTNLECWLLFIKYADNPKCRDKLNEIIKEKEGISMALGVLSEISSSVQERIQYENELLYQLDINTMINNRERKLLAAEKARAEAEKARAEVEEKARAIAEEKAQAEKALVKQLDTVKSFLARGILTESQFAEILGITEEK